MEKLNAVETEKVLKNQALLKANERFRIYVFKAQAGIKLTKTIQKALDEQKKPEEAMRLRMMLLQRQKKALSSYLTFIRIKSLFDFSIKKRGL